MDSGLPLSFFLMPAPHHRLLPGRQAGQALCHISVGGGGWLPPLFCCAACAAAWFGPVFRQSTLLPRQWPLLALPGSLPARCLIFLRTCFCLPMRLLLPAASLGGSLLDLMLSACCWVVLLLPYHHPFLPPLSCLHFLLHCTCHTCHSVPPLFLLYCSHLHFTLMHYLPFCLLPHLHHLYLPFFSHLSNWPLRT